MDLKPKLKIFGQNHIKLVHLPGNTIITQSLHILCLVIVLLANSIITHTLRYHSGTYAKIEISLVIIILNLSPPVNTIITQSLLIFVLVANVDSGQSFYFRTRSTMILTPNIKVTLIQKFHFGCPYPLTRLLHSGC